MSDPIELLTEMWRAASYNHETVGIAIDALEAANKRIADLRECLNIREEICGDVRNHLEAANRDRNNQHDMITTQAQRIAELEGFILSLNCEGVEWCGKSAGKWNDYDGRCAICKQQAKLQEKDNDEM